MTERRAALSPPVARRDRVPEKPSARRVRRRIGERLYNGAIAAGQRLNAAVTAECSHGLPEYFAARAELARLPR